MCFRFPTQFSAGNGTVTRDVIKGLDVVVSDIRTAVYIAGVGNKSVLYIQQLMGWFKEALVISGSSKVNLKSTLGSGGWCGGWREQSA